LQLLPWELTSPAALEVDSSDNSDLLAYAGVVVRRNAVCRDAVAACRARAEELAAEATRRATAKGADAGDASAGFHFADASQRGPFRLDLRLGAALASPPFDALDLGAIWPHVRAALGEDAVLRRRGLVVGLPGASDQAYHADAPRVPPEVWLEHEAAASPTQPPHSLVVFLPLCDLNEENGPTSFLPGSHQRWTSDALEAEADAPGSSSAGAPAILDVDAGDAIIFDSRTQHAGGANRSQRARPVLYLVFARPWFDEARHRRLVGGAGGGDGVQRLFPEFSASSSSGA
jgi:ectoine hydroxylase-related dioxygenase (phytanoyl-CoA dioxygenase family)